MTVRNIGSAATGVAVKDTVPDRTTAVSAGQGGKTTGGKVEWRGLTVPAGGSVQLTWSAQIDPTLGAGTTGIDNDGLVVTSAQHVGATGSPHTTAIAARYAVSLAPATQTGGGQVGADVSYPEHVTNSGYQPDTYTVTTSGAWPTTTYAADCTTPAATTQVVQPGTTSEVCVKVSVPAGASDEESSDSTVTVTSTGDPAVSASATLTTIAATTDTLLVDQDGNAPDVAGIYRTALTSAGAAFSTWDQAKDPVLPESYLRAHKNVVWFTGNSYPDPVGPYEAELGRFLDGRGRLLMSGQDILDQAGRTTAFVKQYLHISWTARRPRTTRRRTPCRRSSATRSQAASAPWR